MVRFKENVEDLLPYNREQYIDFLAGEDSATRWYGVSFQMNSKKDRLTSYLDNYVELFKNVLIEFDNNCTWIVNHDDKDLEWLPNNEKNLLSLRSLFKESNISSAFKGALIFDKSDLLGFSKDLILYPYTLYQKKGFLYKDLDVSHSQIPFVIKLSGHRNIDLLSTNLSLLKRITDANKSSIYDVKVYSSTLPEW